MLQRIREQGIFSLVTRVPFTTDDVWYINRGATDKATGLVLASNCVTFPDIDPSLYAFVAVSDEAVTRLFSKGFCAVPPYAHKHHLGEPRPLFEIPAGLAIRIGFSLDFIGLRVGEVPQETEFAVPPPRTLTELRAMLEASEVSP